MLCLRSDTVIVGHVNRFCYLLTYLITGKFYGCLCCLSLSLLHVIVLLLCYYWPSLDK